MDIWKLFKKNNKKIVLQISSTICILCNHSTESLNKYIASKELIIKQNHSLNAYITIYNTETYLHGYLETLQKK